jgi:hypothetical protein
LLGVPVVSRKNTDGTKLAAPPNDAALSSAADVPLKIRTKLVQETTRQIGVSIHNLAQLNRAKLRIGAAPPFHFVRGWGNSARLRLHHSK